MSWLRWILMAAAGMHFTLLAAVAEEEKGKAKEAPKADAAAKEPAATPKPVEPKIDKATLEKQFAEKMTGAVFSGHYTVDKKQDSKPPQMEKYTISKATKLSDDYWMLTARIEYGKHDLEVPMLLQVKWAGDTPMITLTDLTIPGLGTFTSRVLIYGDRYAGTWQHGPTGGHLFGIIEKAKPVEKE